VKYKRDEINELLVDYVEKEVPEGLKRDLDLLVRNSPIRERSLHALAETRKIVKASEARAPDLSEDFFNGLHDKVMARISDQRPRTRVRLWLEGYSWRGYAAAAVLALVAGSVALSFLKPSVRFQSAGLDRSGDMLVSISVKVPDAFASSLLNDRDADDFYMDAMAEKVANLEKENATDLMNQIGE
jgi:hypothetical protein